MSIELKMPALSPTMEEGTLAKWLVKEGDIVKSGDILAEIETDKATMEFEAVDEGMIAQILVQDGTDGVKVGAPIAILIEEGEDVPTAKPVAAKAAATPKQDAPTPKAEAPTMMAPKPRADARQANRVKASPLARRLAQQQGLDLGSVAGSGPGGRVVKADLDGTKPAAAPAKAEETSTAATPTPAVAVPQAPIPAGVHDIPHEVTKLSSMRKVIARRLTESKQQVPHIYLTVDIRLDALLALRTDLNKSLENRGVKLSVNDMLVKALGVALVQVPACNVMFTGDQLITYKRADISVAVSIPGGLITPIVIDAGDKTLSRIAMEIKDLAGRAREGKLKPEEYQGGTASLSNMGMYGIKQFEAVINPPQGMIMAIGAGEKRAYVEGDQLVVATVMSATGSFDHRAIDGADGAQLMKAFKRLVENPVGMLA